MSRIIDAIVVGVAGVARRDPVLRHAIALAEDLDVALHVVHAFQFTDTVVDAYVRIGHEPRDVNERFRQTLQKRLAEQVEAISTSSRIVVRAEAGPPAWVLTEVGREIGAALLVVGATRTGTLGRHLLGTTAERVVRESAHPVLLLREPFTASAQRVLLATDLSEFSAGICARGVELLGALVPYAAPQLRSLLVVAYNSHVPPPLDRLTLTGVAGTELDNLLEALPVEGIEGTVRVGEPAAEILAEAAEWPADLLVVGTHGRRGWSRLTLGSVAARVLRDARCNVLVIPAAAAHQADADASSATVGAETALAHAPTAPGSPVRTSPHTPPTVPRQT